jgi:hypothetical protein
MAGDEPRAAVALREHPEAVVLHLVKPFRNGRRTWRPRREAGLEANSERWRVLVRKWRRDSTGTLGGVLKPNPLKTLALPRGLYHLNKISSLAESGTAIRHTESLGFLLRLSHRRSALESARFADDRRVVRDATKLQLGWRVWQVLRSQKPQKLAPIQLATLSHLSPVGERTSAGGIVTQPRR